jgi:hypothetical protein
MTYIVVTPGYCRRVQHHATACQLADRLEKNAAASYGKGAGANCFLVADRDGVLEFRGLIIGRRTIGANFGCGDYVLERAAEFVSKEARP